MERFKDFDFFNWSNNPWVGQPGTQWQYPGYCFSGTTHTLSLNKDTPLERPWKVLWQNSVGLKKPGVTSDPGSVVRLQLYTYSPDVPISSLDIEGHPTFKVLMEREIPCPIPSNNCRWHYMTEAEKDVLMSCPHIGGFQFGMRYASGDATMQPIISYSRMMFQYEK